MCEQCEAKTKSYGEIFPGWYLVRAEKDGNFMETGDWGLVIQNDPTFVFETVPKKAPAATAPISSISDYRKYCNKIIEEMSNSTDYPLSSWPQLHEAMEKAGYKKDDGDPNMWLCNYLAEFIEKKS